MKRTLLTPSSRNNPCPICDIADSRCRQSKDDTDYWQCMTYADARKGEIVNGYKCLGHTKDKLWGQFRLDNSQEWSEQQREEWRRERERRQQEQTQIEAEKKSQHLTAVERDQEYFDLLLQLSSQFLHPDDEKDLLRRGLHEGDIVWHQFRSVEQWQRLSIKLNPLLPGVSASGSSLISTGAGYLCPVRDVDGLIVALQQRLRSSGDSGRNRYQWLTSRTKNRPNGQTPHLYPEGSNSGELPLSIHFPSKLLKVQIGICEGVGVKPLLASKRLGIPVIGAAGGQHSSSPHTFKYSIEKLQEALWNVLQECKSQEFEIQESSTKSYAYQWFKKRILEQKENLVKSKDFLNSEFITHNKKLDNLESFEEIELVIIPDAGSVTNKNVKNRIASTISLLKKWNLNIKFAWWGQWEKKDKDIDELDDLSGICYISSEEFFALKQAKESNNQQKLEITLSTPQDNKFPSCLISASGVKFRKIRSSLEELIAVFPELDTKEGKDWLKMRKFTPDVTIHERYFEWENDEAASKNLALAVRSGLNTGKTHYVHNKFLSDPNKGANAFGYRNALLIQFGAKGSEAIEKQGGNNPWYHLQNDLQTQQERSLLLDERSRVAACMDSAPYFQPEAFHKKGLVLDEFEGTLKHLYQSNTAVSYKRTLCKNKIGEAIAQSESVIALDGNLSDITIAHAERISGRRFLKIENTYKGNRNKVFLYDGSATYKEDKKTGKIIVIKTPNDDSLLHRIMLEDEAPLICGSDSQEKLEAWDRLLTEKGHKVFRLDGTNSSTPEAKKFLEDPVKYIIENKITALLYSPTAESGLDIPLYGYFKRSYFFFYGVIGTNEQVQYIPRVRDENIEAHVFTTCHAIKKQTPQLSEDLQKHFVQQHLDCAEISLSDLDDEENTPKLLELAKKMIELSTDSHYLYECQLLAKQSFESANLRKCLEYALREAGHEVEVVTGYKDSKKDLEIVKKENQIINSQKVITAKDITLQEENDIIKEDEAVVAQFESPRDAKRAIIKRRLLERLPGIEQKTQTKVTYVEVSPEVAKDIESRQISPEIAKKLGVPIPEPITVHAINPVHLPQNDSIKADEGGQLGLWDTPSSENVKNIMVKEPETVTEHTVNPVHLPHNIYIKSVEGGQAKTPGMVTLEVTQTEAPVFDTDFVQRVLYRDRSFISAVELHFLLNNPDIAKLLQQRKWYKKLDIFTDPESPDSIKNISLTNNPSRWLKIHTLMKMGIGFFLQPSAVWSDDTPEAISFWEQGKTEKVAKYIGVSVGKDTPCAYIGRVLGTLDIKTKRKKLPKDPHTGKRLNGYSINQEYLDSPMRKAIYECRAAAITQRIQSEDVNLDWNRILKNQQAVEAETLISQSVEPVHLPHNIHINTGEGGQPPISPDTPVISPLESVNLRPRCASNIKFCLSALEALESPDNSSLSSTDLVITLFDEIERRGQSCHKYLPKDFWERCATAVNLRCVQLNSHLFTESSYSAAEDEEEASYYIVSQSRTFIYNGNDLGIKVFDEVGKSFEIKIAKGTILKEVLGADMCPDLWTTVSNEILDAYEPITLNLSDLQLVE